MKLGVDTLVAVEFAIHTALKTAPLVLNFGLDGVDYMTKHMAKKIEIIFGPNMNFEEFLSGIKSLGVVIHTKPYHKLHYIYSKKESIENVDPYIMQSWSGGGIGGGSCWDEGKSYHYAMRSEPEPDFLELDLIIETVEPNITHLKYKKIVKDLITRDSQTYNEYYDNSSIECYKMVDLYKLYKILFNVGE